MVLHAGWADNGHYFSFIQEREGDHRWYTFNDNIVFPYDPNRLPEDTFGDDSSRGRERSSNAYVLIYDRKHKFNSKQEIEKTKSQEQMKEELS